jgi:predicted permease
MWPFNQRSDVDFRHEIEAHVALETDRLVAEGLSPEEAREAAFRTFGNITAARERFYESQRLPWLDELRQDVRYALRMLRRSPGFATVAVLTLALGIGANTAIFSVVNSVILQPLPYQEAHDLVRISEATTAVQGPVGVPQLQGGLNALELEAVRAQTQTLTHVGIYRDAAVTLTGENETTRLQGTRLSPAVLTSLGVQPLFGRTFDLREENDSLVLLSHATWQRYFGADRAILGRSLTLNGTAHSIVGVMPPGFQFPDPATQLWMPTALPAGRLAVLQRMVPLARMKPGIPIETVRTDVATILQRFRQGTTQDGRQRSGEFQVVRLQDDLVAPVKPALLVLTVAVGFVLLIACVNVANLLLARGAARQQEVAVRQALGARRGRLVRQLLTESAVLGLAGGAIGTALALASIRLLRTLGASLPRQDLVAPPSLPRLADITVDVPVLMFTLAVSLLTALMFGLAPAIHQSGGNRLHALRGGSRRPQTQSVLVVAELGIAMMLLIGGGLLIHSFVKLSNLNPGYNPANVLTFTVVTPPGRYSGPQMASFAEDLVARLEAAPGVRAAGYTELLPMVRFRTSGRITTASQRSNQPAPAVLDAAPDPSQPDTFTVSQHFLDAMGIRVIAGRGFNQHDAAGRPGVVLINRALARSGFLGPNPIGQHLSTMKQTWEVVGIVDDVQQFGLDQDPVPQVFFEMRQTPAPGATARVNYFVARTEGEPGALAPSVRDIVRQLDPSATADLVAPMEQLVSNSISRPRLYAVLLAVFAAVATVLAAVGMYGVMAYGVAQRRREIGIRMALGAQRADVRHLVVRQGLVLTGVGLVFGLVAATVATRYLESFLFGVTPLDPGTFAGVSVIFAFIAIFASYLPVRRATNVDPLVALRSE